MYAKIRKAWKEHEYDDVEEMLEQGGATYSNLAEHFASRGQHKEAAAAFYRAGDKERSIDSYIKADEVCQAAHIAIKIDPQRGLDLYMQCGEVACGYHYISEHMTGAERQEMGEKLTRAGHRYLVKMVKDNIEKETGIIPKGTVEHMLDGVEHVYVEECAIGLHFIAPLHYCEQSSDPELWSMGIDFALVMLKHGPNPTLKERCEDYKHLFSGYLTGEQEHIDHFLEKVGIWLGLNMPDMAQPNYFKAASIMWKHDRQDEARQLLSRANKKTRKRFFKAHSG